MRTFTSCFHCLDDADQYRDRKEHKKSRPLFMTRVLLEFHDWLPSLISWVVYSMKTVAKDIRLLFKILLDFLLLKNQKVCMMQCRGKSIVSKKFTQEVDRRQTTWTFSEVKIRQVFTVTTCLTILFNSKARSFNMNIKCNGRITLGVDILTFLDYSRLSITFDNFR